ncbi:hypothetical protein [Bradyrhizobium sp. RDM4]|uniref:hypothetical protein n=1 Tax=Bradyrhizobium sp. RDM4 TaxID=3378765 RepID=UPI0038FC5CDC
MTGITFLGLSQWSSAQCSRFRNSEIRGERLFPDTNQNANKADASGEWSAKFHACFQCSREIFPSREGNDVLP